MGTHPRQLSRLKQRIRNSSIYQRVGELLFNWRGRFFDFRNGVETSGIVRLETLDIPSENVHLGCKYEGVDPRLFRNLFRLLKLDRERFTFVDFGSGKGRELLLAAELPFRRIVGLEFSPDLHRIAERNIRSYDRRRSTAAASPRIESILMDATAWPIPAEPAVFFFHNPFRAPILSSVLGNIRRSLDQAPREAFLVYVYPQRCPGLGEKVERRFFMEVHRSPWWAVWHFPGRANSLNAA